MGLRRMLRKLLADKNVKFNEFLNVSYSQEGEDLVLSRIFESQESGFFVDIGALHPQRFSNTYKFYRAGWRGINVDAMPGSMEIFRKIRPEDINLEIPVSDKIEHLDYHVFNEPALNTFSKELADERSQKEQYHVERVINIKTNTLENILDEHLPKNQKIDFMTIDAEGLDFQILTSNNWAKYSPQIVLIENELELTEVLGSKSDLFMNEKGYKIYAKTVNTYFYKLV
jgi:FkbM family methyltransferase